MIKSVPPTLLDDPYERPNPDTFLIAVKSLSLRMLGELYGGILSMLKQVEADGSLDISSSDLAMRNGGLRCLKPSMGGRGQLVTNLSSNCLSSLLSSRNTCQK